MDHKEIKRLVENGRELKEFIEHKLPRLREEVKKSKYGIDKHRDGFSTGAEIQSLNIREFCYSSFSGSYGDSSTYSDISGLDMIMLRDYFIVFCFCYHKLCNSQHYLIFVYIQILDKIISQHNHI